MKSNNKNSNITWIIISALLIITAVFGFYYLISSISKSAKELVDTKRDIYSFDNRVSANKASQDDYIEIQEGKQKFLSFFIGLDAPVGFIKFMEDLAHGEGLEIKISPMNFPMKRGSWNFIGFSAGVSGSYDRVMRFMEKLEAAPYLIEIQGVELKKTIQESASADGKSITKKSVISADIKFKVYTDENKSVQIPQ